MNTALRFLGTGLLFLLLGYVFLFILSYVEFYLIHRTGYGLGGLGNLVMLNLAFFVAAFQMGSLRWTRHCALAAGVFYALSATALVWMEGFPEPEFSPDLDLIPFFLPTLTAPLGAILARWLFKPRANTQSAL